MDNKTRYSLLKSILINTVILTVVIISTNMLYETNDDYAIASRIVDGYPEVNYVNYYLCVILVKLQSVLVYANTYVIFMIAGSFASFTCILKMIMDRTSEKIIIIATALVITVFSIDHYCTIQFTKTAALMTITALMLMMDSLTNRKGVALARGLAISAIFLYAGAALRIESIPVAVGFAGIYLLYWLFVNRKVLIGEGYLTGKRILLYAVLLAMIGGCYVFNNMSYRANTAGEALRTYKEYSQARSDVVDFGVYDNYEKNSEVYDAMGISENDLYLIDHWYFDYDGAASIDNLKKIKEIDTAAEMNGSSSIVQSTVSCIKSILRSIRRLGYIGIHIILLCVIALWMILSLRPRHWLYIFATGAFALFIYVVLYYLDRPAYRATYMADLGAAVWLLYTLATGHESDFAEGRSRQNKPLWVMGICTALVAALLLIPLHVKCQSSYNGIRGKVMTSGLADYIQENQDSFFVFATSEKKSGKTYLMPWKAPDTEIEKNMLGTGSWGSMSPYVLDKLTAYDMRNPIKDLINNDKAYYIGNKKISRLTEYYNKWYGNEAGKISLQQVAEIDGYAVWKVVSEQH